MTSVRLRTLSLLSIALAVQAPAQDRSQWPYSMDYGPYISATVKAFADDNVALKARVIPLGEDMGVVFDTELLRVAGVWNGGFLALNGVAYDGGHGPFPWVRGAELAATRQEPGWAHDGSFADPRPIDHGPLPKDHGRFHNLYLHDGAVVLEYDVGGVKVLDHFGVLEPGEAFREGDAPAVLRSLQVAPHNGLRTVVAVADRTAAVQVTDREVRMTVAGREEGAVPTQSTLQLAGEGAGFEQDSEGRILMVIEAASEARSFGLTYAGGDGVLHSARDLAGLVQPGANLYPEVLPTTGRVESAADQAYVLDTITVPDANPWNSNLRFAAFDFLDTDSAVLSTWNGDVWRVDGVDGDLDRLEWRRIATGLFEPLGLKVVDGKIYTHGRDQVTRLHDENGDGYIDRYETFNNDVYVTENFHEFAFDLQTDDVGNFYMSKAGPVRPGGRGFDEITPHNGTVLKLSPDGGKLEVYATGLRAPNGIGVSPDGSIITSGDNEGTWMPKCRLNYMRPGAFNGVMDMAHREEAPSIYDDPLCWFPMSVDNSGGGQVWVTSERWGPLQGRMLHQSYGQSSLFLVLEQHQGERVQGGVVRLPLDFDSSQMRARFHDADGQLYVCGFKGWQTNAVKDTAFQRVRYTGQPLRMPVGMRFLENGIELSFSDPLDPQIAVDPSSWEVEIWNYLWSEQYGSAEIKPSAPEQKVEQGVENRDALAVTDIALSEDSKTVLLTVDGLQRVMQIRVGYQLESADEELVEGEIHGTVNFLAPQR